MRNERIRLLYLVILLFFAFTINNNILEANIMESRNLTTAREMLQKGNWIYPTMNGEPRLEKPPLPTWLTALAMKIFGEDNLAFLRLPSVLAGILMIFFLGRLTKELSSDEELPFLTAGTAATSFYILFMARDITWDIFCHCFMLGAIWMIHAGLKKTGQSWKEFTFAALLMNFSFLSKGPVAFYSLLLPYLFARLMIYKWKGLGNKNKPVLAMIFITLFLSLWWPLYAWIVYPDHSLLVAQQESAAWLNRNVKPFYRYWSFPVQTGIWILAATITLIIPYAKKRIDTVVNYKFLVSWVWSAIFLLSLFPEKKERYLLPVLIPLAILTAGYFRYLINAFKEDTKSKADIIFLRLNGIAMFLLSIGIPAALFILSKGKAEPNNLLLILIFLVFFSFAFLFLKASKEKKPLLIWGGMTGLMAIACLLLFPVIPKVMRTNPEYRSYREIKERPDLQDLSFFFNGDISGKFIEIVWNTGHEIKHWNPAENKNLPSDPPFVFISHDPPFNELPPEVTENYTIEVVGHFNTNMRKEDEMEILSNYITLISPKDTISR